MNVLWKVKCIQVAGIMAMRFCVCLCVCVPVECAWFLPSHPRAVASALAFPLQALPGPHYYTWGDHGGIIMAIAQGMETNELK